MRSPEDEGLDEDLDDDCDPKGSHSQPCSQPSLFLRRAGTVWACQKCGQLWVVVRINAGADSYKVWKKLEDLFNA